MDGFEWDENKRSKKIEKYKLDFLRAMELFDGRPTVSKQARSDVEPRTMTTGLIDEVLRTLIWTDRDGVRRFICFRSARDAEKRQYRQLHGR